MSIFNLHAAVLDDYRDFVRSFFSIADDRARDYVERALVADNRGFVDSRLSRVTREFTWFDYR